MIFYQFKRIKARIFFKCNLHFNLKLKLKLIKEVDSINISLKLEDLKFNTAN